ncbi:MAG: UDP-N-acetylmuramoyl-tripeptide--D-alanyl-D-alanine ligase [Tissierellia bacterium]|nr:UDP-N-acetylmuramoyl-tripeptide--D-alanyl-D-alanine ligase [Tissierellia bacterium]
MIQATIRQISEWVNGTLTQPSAADQVICGVSKDTRTLESGNLYIPLRGEHFDGHSFLSDAIDNGATASLWARDLPIPNTHLPLILVGDPLLAMQLLAHQYRRSLPVQVIGITGSNGKTSTKDILSPILREKYRVVENRGNENNEIGVPLTLLSMNVDTEICITEMGTERPGEIEVLTRMAEPNIAMITNVADSHLEELGSKAGVAREKLEIVLGLPEQGYFLYNSDDPILSEEAEKKFSTSEAAENFHIKSYGTRSQSDFQIQDIQVRQDEIRFSIEQEEYQASICGRHQIYNGALAVCVARLLGLTPDQIRSGLQKVNFTGMRNEWKHYSGFDVLDDSYKANPQNLSAALDIMQTSPSYARRIAVLGDMLGLGENAAALHYAAGRSLKPDTIDYLLTYGPLMKQYARGAVEVLGEAQVLSFDEKAELWTALRDLLVENTLILVKGSRDMHMESIVRELSLLTGD